MTATQAPHALARLLKSCRNDPVKFNDRVLRRPPLHAAQVEWVEALVTHKVVAVETSNALGKDWLAGGLLVPWWLLTRPDSLVVATCPSHTLLGSVVFKEAKTAIANCPFVKAGMIKVKMSDSVGASPQIVELGPNWRAMGLSTTSVERLSGQHNGQLLVLVGEASGAGDHVWEAISGLGYLKAFLYGNPLRADGGFVKLCDQGVRDAVDGVPPEKAVRYFNADAWRSPHIDLDHSPVGLANKGWLDEMERQYGRDSLWWRVHVEAKRPDASTELVFDPRRLGRATSEAAATAATIRRNRGEAGPRRIALDASRGVGADKTTIVLRDDAGILEVVNSNLIGVKEAARLVKDLMAKWAITRADRVSFDAGGDVGRDMAQALKDAGVHAVAYYGGSTRGRWNARYANQRAAAAFALRRALHPDRGEPFHLAPFPGLDRLLDAMTNLRQQLKGDVVALEGADDFRARLGWSPDELDALAQSFWSEALR